MVIGVWEYLYPFVFFMPYPNEVYQIFVPGRGVEVKDVLIDSAGASIGVLMYLVISRLMKKEIPTEL
jgi:VanZ family protein